MNVNYEPAELVLAYLRVHDIDAWSSGQRDAFLNWIDAGPDRDIWHILKDAHQTDDRGLIDYVALTESDIPVPVKCDGCGKRIRDEPCRECTSARRAAVS